MSVLNTNDAKEINSVFGLDTYLTMAEETIWTMS